MSTRFDDEVQASWGEFEAQVGRALAEIGDDSFSIDLEGETDESGAFPHVEFAGYDGMVRVEVAGNDVLDPAHRMDVDQETALVAICWQQPSDDESPHWRFDVSRDERDVVPTMVTAAFRQVFGVVHPKFLVSERLWPDDNADETDDAEESPVDDSTDDDSEGVMGFPDDYDHLVRMVRRSLAHIYGDDVVRDDDGDFPIVTGTAPIWVRVERDKPIVRIFSYVVRSVRDVRQARIEIGILNQRQDLLKFVYADSVITATYDLSAVPFAGPQLMWVLSEIEEQLDDLARDAALRVGGKLWLDPATTRATNRSADHTSDHEESA